MTGGIPLKTKSRPIWRTGGSILLFFAMMVCTTFAWYGGTVYNKENKVKAENLSIAAYVYEGDEEQGVVLATQRDLSEIQTPLIQGDAWTAGAHFIKYLEVRNRGTAAVQITLDFTVTDNSSVNSLWYQFSQLDASWKAIGGQSERRPMNTLETLGDMYAYTLEPGGVVRFKLEYGVEDGETGANIHFEADTTVSASLAGETDKVISVYDAVDFNTTEDCATFRLMQDIEGSVTLNRLANVDLNGYTLDGDLSFGTADSPILTAGSAIVGSEAAGGEITGALSLYTPNADISQYGTVGSVVVGALANQSLYFYGSAKSTVEVVQGRLVLGKDAWIPEVAIPADVKTVIRIDNDGVIESLDAPVTDKAYRPVVVGNAVQSITEGTSANLEGATLWDGQLLKQPPLEDGIFQVGTAAELAWIADSINQGTLERADVRITDDIDLNDREWSPIGNDTHPFAGSFDGQGHTIHNLQIFEGAQWSGLFGTVSGAAIRNVILDSAHLKNVGSESAALVGRSMGCTLENCRVLDSIVAADEGAASVGGLVGRVESGAFGVSGCRVENTRISGYFNLGGLVGYCEASDMVNAIIAECTVERVTVTASPYRGENEALVGKRIQTHSFIGMATADAPGSAITIRGCAIRDCSHNGDTDTMIGGEALNAWIARASGNIMAE